MLHEADDGLLGRILWLWPAPVPFRLGLQTPRVEWAIRALDRLRELDLQPGDPPIPIRVPLVGEGRGFLESFARHMQQRQQGTDGLLRAALGKARGQALRLALVLEMLWWCSEDGASPPPTRISLHAFVAAAELIGDYFMAMAQRVYGDITTTPRDRHAAALAHWILKTRPPEVHIRHLQREVRLPGLRTAGQIRDAAEILTAAGWLRPPALNTRLGRGRGLPTASIPGCGYQQFEQGHARRSPRQAVRRHWRIVIAGPTATAVSRSVPHCHP